MNLREFFDYQSCLESLNRIDLIIFDNKYLFTYHNIRSLERNLDNVRIIVFQLRNFIFNDLKSMKIIYEIANYFFIKFRYKNETHYLLFFIDFNCFHYQQNFDMLYNTFFFSYIFISLSLQSE